MTGFGIFAAIVCGLCVLWAVIAIYNYSEGAGFAFFLALVFGVMAWVESGDAALEREAERDRKEQARKIYEQTPRVIREFDGCKVYQFEAEGRARFVTVCKDKVTTSWGRTESCGKNCSRTVDESIETVKEKQ